MSELRESVTEGTESDAGGAGWEGERYRQTQGRDRETKGIVILNNVQVRVFYKSRRDFASDLRS